MGGSPTISVKVYAHYGGSPKHAESPDGNQKAFESVSCFDFCQ